MAERFTPELSPEEATLLVPVWCRAQCALQYPELGVGREDAELLRRLRAGVPDARRSEPLLYALRRSLMAGSLAEWLARHPEGTLVDLGCGLDTLLRSVDNGCCRMVYADLSGAIALRAGLLPPRERETYIAADLRERGALAAAGISGEACFVMGGLLCHLTEGEARALIARLAAEFPGSCAVFDALGFVPRAPESAQIRSRLPGTAALRRWEGVGSVLAERRLPVSFRRLPPGKRLRLRALLASGALRFYECRLA